MATVSKQLLALAVAFGVITEGLDAAQVQEALDANEGYKKFKDSVTALEAESAAKVKAEADLKAKESELATLKKEVAEKDQQLLDADVQVRDLVNRIDELEALTATKGIKPTLKYTSRNGVEYVLTVEKFRYLGVPYTSAEAVEKHHDVLEDLIDAESFILKQL